MVPVLPPEVTDCIIDALHDRQTLCSCALTCRNWLPASRYNLFYRITINKRPNYDALLWEDKEMPWVHVIPHVFSTHLRNVRFLTIGDFIWDTFRLPPSFYTLGSHFTSVSTLELCSGRFSTFSEFRRLICAFPQLSRLFVQDTEWSRSPRTPFPSTNHAFTMHRPRLELLWFDSAAEGGVTTLVDWLLRTPSAQSISDLQLWRQGRSEFVACEKILESLGPSLEHFQLSLDCRSEDGVLNLAHNSNLQTLSIRNVEAPTCDHVPILLHQISSYQIREISFHVSVKTAAELETCHSYWTEVGTILERAQFRKLQRVTMWWRPPPETTVGFCDFVQEMESRLHDLRARGLLRMSEWLK